jgi:hypothetical protein
MVKILAARMVRKWNAHMVKEHLAAKTRRPSALTWKVLLIPPPII